MYDTLQNKEKLILKYKKKKTDNRDFRYIYTYMYVHIYIYIQQTRLWNNYFFTKVFQTGFEEEKNLLMLYIQKSLFLPILHSW